MGKTVLERQLETYKKKINIIEHAISASAGSYYNINITHNLIPGTMYQVIDNVEYSINEAIGFPNDCKYWDVIEYWGNQLAEEIQPDFFAFFSLDHLTECFENGEDHIYHRYWSKDALGNPMLAEQHVVMYRDLMNNDLLAITYVLDHTKLEELRNREAEQRRLLEEDIRKIEGLASQYSALYFIDFTLKKYKRYCIGRAEYQEYQELNDDSSDSFLNTFRKYIEVYTHPDFAAELARLTDEDYLKQLLRHKKRYIYRFLNTGKNGQYQWLELVLIKFADIDEEATHIAFAFLNVDEEEREKAAQRKALIDALADVLHDLRTIIQSSISAKRQDLFIDTQDILNEDIITDKLRLNQVLLNIISNAIKFTPVGGIISIRISEKPCALSHYTTYEFRIRDNGIGMTEEFQKHIFESFSREQTATVSGIQGTGLGMAITKNIVDMMGGTIMVKSKEGEGTEFVVVLDCKLSDNIVKYEPVPELQGARALVVDDDTNTCISVNKMLKQIGMRADWTVSGKEAIVRAREAYEEGDEFKAYIIDWLMPDMNGIAIL